MNHCFVYHGEFRPKRVASILGYRPAHIISPCGIPPRAVQDTFVPSLAEYLWLRQPSLSLSCKPPPHIVSRCTATLKLLEHRIKYARTHSCIPCVFLCIRTCIQWLNSVGCHRIWDPAHLSWDPLPKMGALSPWKGDPPVWLWIVVHSMVSLLRRVLKII